MGEAIQPAEFVNVSRLGQLTAEGLQDLQDKLLVHDNEGRSIAVVIGYQQFMKLQDKLREARAAIERLFHQNCIEVMKEVDRLVAQARREGAAAELDRMADENEASEAEADAIGEPSTDASAKFHREVAQYLRARAAALREGRSAQ